MSLDDPIDPILLPPTQVEFQDTATAWAYVFFRDDPDFQRQKSVLLSLEPDDLTVVLLTIVRMTGRSILDNLKPLYIHNESFLKAVMRDIKDGYIIHSPGHQPWEFDHFLRTQVARIMRDKTLELRPKDDSAVSKLLHLELVRHSWTPFANGVIAGNYTEIGKMSYGAFAHRGLARVNWFALAKAVKEETT